MRRGAGGAVMLVGALATVGEAFAAARRVLGEGPELAPATDGTGLRGVLTRLSSRRFSPCIAY